jgi:hypothetical protein
MVRGQPLFDGLAVMEFTCDLTRETVHLEAKAAFVQTTDVGEHKAGKTHGSTTCTHWSSNTMKKLLELREAMEQDLAHRHFKDVFPASAGISPEDVGGIGENLDEDEHRSI